MSQGPGHQAGKGDRCRSYGNAYRDAPYWNRGQGSTATSSEKIISKPVKIKKKMRLLTEKDKGRGCNPYKTGPCGNPTDENDQDG